MSHPEPPATGAYAPTDSLAVLTALVDQYLADLEAGRSPDRARLLAEHPDLARPLEQCLAGIDFIHQAAQARSGTPTQLGDFRILREIGRGGMGVVYEAEQLSLRRRVALKVLRFAGVADEEAMQRFQREAETVACLHHTNIVPIFAVDCEHGVHYYAMQLIDGRSLANVYEEAKGALEPKTVARWGLQAAEALDHAHQRGVVHRDVKPSNLILDTTGSLWLTDFGLARRLDEVKLTLSGALVGTPRYMSPEQAVAARQGVDHRSDVYSLGATLYELATGRPVCDADTPEAVLLQILTAEPVPPRQVRRDLPRDLETILLTCLAKEPARRYSTARALAEDLRALLDDRPIKARRPSLLERGQRWVRDQRLSVRTVAGLAALLLILVGLATAWAIAYQVTTQREQVRPVEVKVNDPFATPGAWAAEVLAADRDEPLLPRFAIPTMSPISVPVGTHRLRVLRPGWLSETYPITVAENVSGPQRFEIQTLESAFSIGGGQALLFLRQHLWPKPVDHVTASAILRSGKGIDVITLTQEPGLYCQRLDGKTGTPRWRQALGTDTPLDQAWHPVTLFLAAALREPTLDVDGDGTPDLLWLNGIRPSVLAMSGENGGLLWCYTLPEAAGPQPNIPQGGALTALALPDVDGDGAPDLAVVLRWKPMADEAPQWFLQGISGRTGKGLWRVPLPAIPRSNDRDEEQIMRRFSPQVISLQGRRAIIGLASERLLCIDAASGEPLWPSSPVAQPLAPAQFADLRGDGSTVLLVLHRDAGPGVRLTAYTLPELATLWERAWPEMPEPLGPDWPLLTDLDGDGRPEVIVRQSQSRDGDEPEYDTETSTDPTTGSVTNKIVRNGKTYRARFEEKLGIVVLDGATGTTRWQRWLGRSDRRWSHPEAPLRFLIGPELDGRRDLFVASVLSEPWLSASSTFLYVDALSGTDGRSLWWWRQHIGEKGDYLSFAEIPGRMCWWPARNPGRPVLVVPFLRTENRSACWVLDSGTGRQLHVLPQLMQPDAADLNGDGWAELLGITRDQRFDSFGTLNPIPGHAVTQGIDTPLQPSAADPRQAVLLPWDRHWLLGALNPASSSLQMSDYVLIWTTTSLFGVIAIPFAVIWCRRRQAKRTPEQTRARKRQQLVFLSICLVIAVGLVLIPAGLWLWSDAVTLLPEEHYRWRGWYVSMFLATNFVYMVVLAVGGIGWFLVRRVTFSRARAPGNR